MRLKAGDQAYAEQIARALPFMGGTRTGDDAIDAKAMADRIEELVYGLGLAKKLDEYKVGGDQVGVVARTATGMENGEVFEGVKGIVESRL